ncbi:hypothetical protein Tco_1118495 [Tanacetum coccineum]
MVCENVARAKKKNRMNSDKSLSEDSALLPPYLNNYEKFITLGKMRENRCSTLGKGTEQVQVIFDINEREAPLTISPVCVVNDFQEIDEFEGPKDLEELLINYDINGDFKSFLENNDLLSSLDTQGNTSVSPPNLLKSNDESYRVFNGPDNNMSIRLDDFIEVMDDI